MRQACHNLRLECTYTSVDLGRLTSVSVKHVRETSHIWFLTLSLCNVAFVTLTCLSSSVHSELLCMQQRKTLYANRRHVYGFESSLYPFTRKHQTVTRKRDSYSSVLHKDGATTEFAWAPFCSTMYSNTADLNPMYSCLYNSCDIKYEEGSLSLELCKAQAWCGCWR